MITQSKVILVYFLKNNGSIIVIKSFLKMLATNNNQMQTNKTEIRV